MIPSFFRRCCFLLVPSCMKRHHSPIASPSSAKKQLIEAPNAASPQFSTLAVADGSIEPVEVEPAGTSLLVSEPNTSLIESTSTWDLDILFSGSYLYASSETQHDRKSRRRFQQKQEPGFIERPPKAPKIFKPRPTHFLAVRINSPQIVEAVCRAQADMIERLPGIESTIIPASKLHVTLSVLYLPNREDVDAVRACLSSCTWQFNNKASGNEVLPDLHLHGVGDFRDSVIYASFRPGDGAETLKNVASTAVKCIKQIRPSALIEKSSFEDNDDDDEAGHEEEIEIEIEDKSKTRNQKKKGREFQPHVTLAKVSRTGNFRNKKHKPLKKIDRKAHEHLADVYFGPQCWNGIQLLAMQWPSTRKTQSEPDDQSSSSVALVSQKRSDGYYFIESEVVICTQSQPADDSSD